MDFIHQKKCSYLFTWFIQQFMDEFTDKATTRKGVGLKELFYILAVGELSFHHCYV